MFLQPFSEYLYHKVQHALAFKKIQGTNMAYERIMGLQISDDVEYQKYRQHMIPILHSYGGDFGFDFRVSEVLKSKDDSAINRVFTIEFPDKVAMEKFFNDSKYLAVKNKYFLSSVQSVTTISMHEKTL